MGEIGIPRLEYLYDLTFCDIYLIERGYHNRNRDLWSSTRWSTYYIMMSFVGGDGMKKSGITSPKDLIQFPWEKEKVIITDDEQKALLKEIEAFNQMKSKPQP